MQVFHILFNMLMLWFFGAELELRWGSRYFLFYYLFSGVGAAIIYCLGVWLYALTTGAQTPLLVPVVGASGAIFGLMLAHGILFSERIVSFMMLFPMKTKYFVALMALIQMASLVTNSVAGGEVAYLAHLGGFASGYLALWLKKRWPTGLWKKKVVHRKRNLRLVPNEDESSSNSKDGPKYWN
jgi:membrane associated rhomboid family serine protease